MRIRKRLESLPFSSLSSEPLSDPFFPRSSEPKSPHPPDTAVSGSFQPFDQMNRRSPLIGIGKNGCDSSGDASGSHKKENNLKCSEDDGEEDGEKGSKTSRGFSSAATINGFLLKSDPSSPVEFGKWDEGERAFPPKKRRMNMVRRENEDSSSIKMKTKMNKRCDGEESSKECTKKRARGSALMEGSRCSRVNGRGWRCCQQTLVGYSLCEHHLGNGRLRSMSSVRSRSALVSAPNLQKNEGKRPEEEEEDDEKPPLITTKKKMKIGMVKARSLSSLLGQTNNMIYMVDDDEAL